MKEKTTNRKLVLSAVLVFLGKRLFYAHGFVGRYYVTSAAAPQEYVCYWGREEWE